MGFHKVAGINQGNHLGAPVGSGLMIDVDNIDAETFFIVKLGDIRDSSVTVDYYTGSLTR